jgi:hypothetical protein
VTGRDKPAARWERGFEQETTEVTERSKSEVLRQKRPPSPNALWRTDYGGRELRGPGPSFSILQLSWRHNRVELAGVSKSQRTQRTQRTKKCPNRQKIWAVGRYGRRKRTERLRPSCRRSAKWREPCGVCIMEKRTLLWVALMPATLLAHSIGFRFGNYSFTSNRPSERRN